MLIADEPTTALDVTIQAQILELIKNLKNEIGTSVILITHDLGVVAGMTDKIIVMYAGKVFEQAPTAELFATPANPYTKGLLKSVPDPAHENGAELYQIPGLPPDVAHLPPGCPFAERCERAEDICRAIIRRLSRSTKIIFRSVILPKKFMQNLSRKTKGKVNFEKTHLHNFYSFDFNFFRMQFRAENANTAINAAVNAPANTVAETEPEIDVNAPFVPSENPKDDLLNSTKRLQAYNAWAATLVNNLMPEMKTELEYSKPDRYRIKNPVTEVIVIGSDGYIKEQGKWKKIPEDIGAQIEAMKKSFNAESMKTIKEVSKSEGEKIDGQDAILYTYSIQPGANTPKNSTKVWIAKDSGLPLKIIVETENADATQRVTTAYDYKKQVKIEAPKTVEETEAP